MIGTARYSSEAQPQRRGVFASSRFVNFVFFEFFVAFVVEALIEDFSQLAGQLSDRPSELEIVARHREATHLRIDNLPTAR